MRNPIPAAKRIMPSTREMMPFSPRIIGSSIRMAK